MSALPQPGPFPRGEKSSGPSDARTRTLDRRDLVVISRAQLLLQYMLAVDPFGENSLITSLCSPICVSDKASENRLSTLT
jgi:hypothetical protein